MALLSVNKAGKVVGVKVVKKAGYGFDELAQKYMKKWKFSPAEENCEKVASTGRYTYTFTIQDY